MGRSRGGNRGHRNQRQTVAYVWFASRVPGLPQHAYGEHRDGTINTNSLCGVERLASDHRERKPHKVCGDCYRVTKVNPLAAQKEA